MIPHVPTTRFPPGRSLRVLVVDNNADCADSMAMVLRLYGHAVGVAADGPTALRMVAADAPDVVLLELRLPNMTGYELARRLVAPRPALTPLVVAVTGWGTDDAWRMAADSGVDLHLVKPVDPDVIAGVLGRFRQAIVPC